MDRQKQDYSLCIYCYSFGWRCMYCSRYFKEESAIKQKMDLHVKL